MLSKDTNTPAKDILLSGDCGDCDCQGRKHNHCGALRVVRETKRSLAMDRYNARNLANLRSARRRLAALGLPVSADTVYPVDVNKPLSVRELEIIQLSVTGMSNPEIAEILSISRHTVKSHFDHIFNKLGVSNRTMAVVWAVRQGLM